MRGKWGGREEKEGRREEEGDGGREEGRGREVEDRDQGKKRTRGEEFKGRNELEKENANKRPKPYRCVEEVNREEWGPSRMTFVEDFAAKLRVIKPKNGSSEKRDPYETDVDYDKSEENPPDGRDSGIMNEQGRVPAGSRRGQF